MNHPLMTSVRSFLRCETTEDCRRIQRGHLLLRRLGKFSSLFTLAIALLINDLISQGIEDITSRYRLARRSYHEATSSTLYRWTVGWVKPAHSIPDIDHRAIAVYNTLNAIQFAGFILVTLWCLRWVYADCRVAANPHLTFGRLLILAGISNLVLYGILRGLLSAYLG